MKTKIFVGAILFLSVIIANSCEDKQAALPPVPCNADTANLTYSSGTNTMLATINVQCGVSSSNLNCHGANGVGATDGYDFTMYAGILAQYQNGNLFAALFGGGSSVPQMPLTPQTGWDQCDLNLFKAWIARGCPE
jgi:hypothetical protein